MIIERKHYKMFVVFLLSTFSVLGCDRAFARTYVKHPEAVKFQHPTISLTTESHIKGRVSTYLKDNPSTQSDVRSALLEFKIQKGMNQEQVKVVVGDPSKRKVLKGGIEVWTYDRNLSGNAFLEAEFPVSWYYKWAKLKFDRETLVDIEVQQIEWKIDL